MYEQTLNELKNFLAKSQQGKQNSQEKFDNLLLELQKYKFLGYEKKFFINLFEQKPSLEVRQRLARYLRRSQILIPQELRVRKYLMSDGTITENPIRKQENEEMKKEFVKTERIYYTSYNVVRKTIYYYKNNRYQEFEHNEPIEETKNYEMIRKCLNEIKKATISKNILMKMKEKENYIKQKQQNNITQFFLKWF
jgi:hypothetical protein